MALLRHQQIALSGLKFLFSVALLALVVWCFAGCRPARETIPVYHESSAYAAEIAASLEAVDKGGNYYLNGSTASMIPNILPHDYVVAIKTPYAELKVGMVVNYRPDWNEKRLTCHRLVATWPNGGFIAEGDGPHNSPENQARVDATNYVDHVISVYRSP